MATTFHDPLIIGRKVRYSYTNADGCDIPSGSGSGIYIGVALDEEDHVPCHYFILGEINGLEQESHGFPCDDPTRPTTTDLTPTSLIQAAL